MVISDDFRPQTPATVDGFSQCPIGGVHSILSVTFHRVASLVVRMQRSDFETAVRRHQRKVFTFAHYFLSNREEAEDVTQEVLIRLWRNRGKVGLDRVGSWLLTVTRNACYDRLRQRRSVAHLVESHMDDQQGAIHVAAAGPDPEAQAGSAQLGRRLLKALGQLSDQQRSVVILREIQGLSYQEIAEVLDLSLSRVKVTLHRGRQALRENLREVYDHALAC
jgi:RNA polymerase sigma-70 factor (ECF subfamily)